MLRLLTLIAFLVCSASAQTVRLANNSGTPFEGWVRTQCDARPAHAAGVLPDGSRYVTARRTGLDTWAVDVRVQLQPGQRRSIDLAAAAAAPPPALLLPHDLLGHFGGWITVGDQLLGVAGASLDGAAVAVHFAGRVTPMLHVDVWTRWYPDQPGLVVGEAVVCASNGSIPDMGATVDQPLVLRWGDGWVHVLGAGWGGPIVPAGTAFADGQARAVPFCIAWRRHLPDTALVGWSQVVAAAGRSVSAIGVERLWPDGNPQLQPGLDAATWTAALWPTAQRRLHTWEPGVVGPNPNSGDTGAQEDQVFVRGEPMVVGGEGAEQVAYLAALEQASRPAHHLEAHGRQADPADHPNCVFWSGRPHWHPNVSPDQLGKAGLLPDTHGWSAQDREHWLCNTLAAAGRLVDSPAVQWILEQHARSFLFGETVRPGWSTSRADAARSVGWAGIVAVHLWRGLEDRALAERVRVRYRDRCELVYLPQLGAQLHDVWDVRRDDPRLGTGDWWMAWQQSIGSYGLDLACREFDLPAGRALALRAAKACVAHNWVLQGERYHGVGNIRFPPPAPSAYEGRVWPEPWFETTWDLPALWVVLQAEPGHEKARAVWQQAMADLGTGRRSWVPPGAVPPVPVPDVPTATSVSRQGITWTFAAPRPVGVFANGDPWVVGPVQVVAITPGVRNLGGRITGGSMLNPMPHDDGWHGYDSALYGQNQSASGASRYHANLNVGAQLPLTIVTGSLISTIPQVGPAPNQQESQLQVAAVLTVLAAAPPADSFRPAYCGTDKAVQWSMADVDLDALPRLAIAPGGPSPSAVTAPFDASLFLDHTINWAGRYMHPTAGLGDYYRAFTRQQGDAALIACADLPPAAKRAAVVHLVQWGIDSWRMTQLGASWGVNGHCNGRKFPILFAGRVLGAADMLAAGVAYQPHQVVAGVRRTGSAIDATLPVVVPFSEDGQTFYVRETGPGVINWGHGGYTAAHVGLAEWGNFHLGRPDQDYATWLPPAGRGDYRRCCSAISWSAPALAMRAMALQLAWNQPAWFDYVDRYMQTEKAGTVPGDEWVRGEPWHQAMWDMHRGDL